MNSKKGDLEIIYNLKWKNGTSVNGGVKESMIGVYDIPATTLNWEVFKSYLLKNSGTDGDDVHVSYLMDSGREYPIQSQTDFQVALYAFRRKARAGETINLKLERISDQPNYKNLRHSNDAETQFDHNEQCSFISTTCCANSMGDNAPEWFSTSLAQLKKEIAEEVTASVSSIVTAALANVKQPTATQPEMVPPPRCEYHHSRKGKGEKRLRKITPNFRENKMEAKDLIKSLKLDSKLDKLERKANKIKEKRSMLFHCPAKSSDSEAGHSSSRSRSHDKEGREEKKMNAQPNKVQEFVPHMLGGEIYLHSWEVKNSGELPWTSKTCVQYTWGSKALEPLEKTISVPYLKPGEIGTISARLQVPNEPGRYECYWQFMHKGRRFGHWLGAQLVVDPFDLKGNRSVLETSTRNIELDADEGVSSAPEEIVRQYEKVPVCEERKEPYDFYNLYQQMSALNQDTSRPLLSDSDTESNQDNQSVASLDDSNNSNASKSLKEEYVLVPKCFILDTTEADEKKNLAENLLVNIDGPSTSGIQTTKADKAEEKAAEKVPDYKISDIPQPEICDDNNNENDAAKSTNSNGQSTKTSIDQGSTLSVASTDSGDSDYEVALVVGEDGKTVKDMRTKVKKGTKKDGFVFIKVGNAEPKNELLHLPKTILNSDLVQVIDGLKKTSISEESVAATASIQKASVPVSITPSVKSGGELLDLSVASADKSQPKTPILNQGVQPHSKINTTSTALISEQVEIGSEVMQASAAADELLSHCSAAGSSFSEANPQGKRLFVFPTDCPGYEVVYPVLDRNESGDPMVCSQYYTSGESTIGPHYTYVPNYQQTPTHLRQNDPFVKADANQAMAYPATYQPGLQYYNYESPYPVQSAYSQGAKGQYVTDGTGQGIYQGQYAYPGLGASQNSTGYADPATIQRISPQQQVREITPSLFGPDQQNFTETAASTKNAVPTSDYVEFDTEEYAQLCRNLGQQERGPIATNVSNQSRATRGGQDGNAAPQADAASAPEAPQQTPPQAPPRAQPESGPIHILPEGIVTGAVNVASSAINTARNVMDMFRPQPPGRWVNGHWVSFNPQTPREVNLQALLEMGFFNRDLNATLLARFNDDLNRVVAELVQ